MDCLEILYRHSWSPGDKSYWLWWSPHFFIQLLFLFILTVDVGVPIKEAPLKQEEKYPPGLTFPVTYHDKYHSRWCFGQSHTCQCEYYKPLCRDLASDVSLNRFIWHLSLHILIQCCFQTTGVTPSPLIIRRNSGLRYFLIGLTFQTWKLCSYFVQPMTDLKCILQKQYFFADAVHIWTTIQRPYRKPQPS